MKFFVNFLSAFRIVAAFAIVPLLIQNNFAWTFWVFVIASLTDFFDGLLAKRFNASSKLGAVLDQIADKFLATNALIMLAIMSTLQGWLIIVPAIVMICRDLYVSGLREFLGAHKADMPVPSPRFSMAKAKTFLQMLFLSLIFFSFYLQSLGYATKFTAYYLPMWSLYGLWIAMAAAILSAIAYTKDFAKKIKRIK
ncbi:MAG: CDP-alcohol phosphatidyltransferase family protein [Proteobacteria bacterium]|nr:CDP-alcohol phosphatidyltransferase family protein [Pseudomonadota bacterium]